MNNSNFKIATWNINSIRVRLEQLINWLQTNQPDIMALQETKVQDHDFPHEAIENAGFYVTFSGQKSYNGVAIISKKQPEEIITDIPSINDPQRRVLGVTIDDLRLINLYVPNGTDLASPNFLYKLQWLAKLKDYLKEQLKEYKNLAVVGDFNIAPTDFDVYDPRIWHDRLLVTPPERDAFFELINLGLFDSYRIFEPEKRDYTWWDYRHNGFARNQGLRIDFALLSAQLKNNCQKYYVDKSMRAQERPSDHAPVVVEI